MARHFAHAALIVLVAAILPIAVVGCGESEQPPKAATKGPTEATSPEHTQPAATEATTGTTSAESTQEKPYSKDFFGPWNADVAQAHLPQITYEKAGDGLKVTVKVDDHPMNAAIPHYIMWIRIEDSKGNVLGRKDFVATDPAPIATFDLAAAPDKIVAFERCNIHGIWTSETDVK